MADLQLIEFVFALASVALATRCQVIAGAGAVDERLEEGGLAEEGSDGADDVKGGDGRWLVDCWW
jgi:hypothetical protein